MKTLEQEVKTFGAKGATLKYIHENDPSIQIEPFVLVPIGHDWAKYSGAIEKLGESLVRSSSPLEDGQRLSFAGLFATTPFSGASSVNWVLNSVNDEDARDYARIHGVTEPIQMGLVFQKNSKSKMNWSMVRHPHQKNLIFVMGKYCEDPFGARISYNFIFDEKTGKLQDVHDYSLEQNGREEDISTELLIAMSQYRRIEKMPAFQTGFTYQMEFGTDPFSVYQFRPFRKAENPPWNLDENTIEKMREDSFVLTTPIVFGTTPPEGLELTLARALTPEMHRESVKSFREKFSKKPYDVAVSRLLKAWKNLSPQERAYAEEVAKINPNEFGANESDAFDRAVVRLNAVAEKDKTALYQENMHFYHGRAIDLVFPNAKAWIGDGAVEFLSHGWFRAAQTYDIALLGGMTTSKTGDKIRIYSDGVNGVVRQSNT